MAKKPTEAPRTEKSTRTLAVADKGKTLPAVRRTGTKIAGKGFENLEREDILLPRLKLLQAQSPEVMESDEKPGTLFMNLQNKGVGEKTVITPVLHYRSRIKWIPKDDGGGMDCSAPDAKSPASHKYATSCAECKYKNWDETKKDKKEQAPECTMYENFVVLLADSTEPVILSMAKSQVKVAKKFYSMMAVKGGDMFDFLYELAVVKEKNDQGQTYFNFAVRDLGKKTDEKRKLVCDSLWASLAKANIRTELEHPDGGPTGEPAAAVPAGEGKF